MERRELISEPWRDYEVLDSGNNEKLERFGSYLLIRPETQAIWSPKKPDLWKKADARFIWSEGKGFWKNKSVPQSWQMSRNELRFAVRLTSFKHTGIFPEQAPNWDWVSHRIAAMPGTNVLNLFGYTGLASIAAAQAGARVTHLDASKQSNAWAKDNAVLSGLPESSIRFILDDAVKFVEREERRGSKYEGIILDPPAFGRGAKGEVWHIEEDLIRLLLALRKILSGGPGSFFLLNGYAAGYSPTAFMQAVQNVFGEVNGEYGELNLREQEGRLIPSGIFVRFAL